MADFHPHRGEKNEFGSFWLTQLQSWYVWWVILKLISSVYQEIRKLNPNIPWNFIFALYLTSLMTREVESRKFQNCFRDMKIFYKVNFRCSFRKRIFNWKKYPLGHHDYFLHFFEHPSDHPETLPKLTIRNAGQKFRRNF